MLASEDRAAGRSGSVARNDSNECQLLGSVPLALPLSTATQPKALYIAVRVTQAQGYSEAQGAQVRLLVADINRRQEAERERLGFH